MALPAYVTLLGNIRGPEGAQGKPGERGKTGTFAEAYAVRVPYGSTDIKPVVTGPENERTITFKVPGGAPALGAQSDQETIAGYVADEASPVREAMVETLGVGVHIFADEAAFKTARSEGRVPHQSLVIFAPAEGA